MDIKPIEKMSMSEQICNQIKQLVLEGKWKGGDKLDSEIELCAAFGVSRVTIREAMLKLKAQGILESRFGAGTYVKDINNVDVYINSIIPIAYLGTESILDVMVFRQVIEIRSAGISAGIANEEDIENLESIYQDMIEGVEDHRKFSKADLDFHMAIINMTNNKLIIGCMNLIKEVLGNTISKAIEIKGRQGAILDHKRLIESMKKNDVEDTMIIMEEHLQDVHDKLSGYLKKT